MNHRLYTFNHLWLSSLQKGLQSAHVVSELFVDYASPQVARAKHARQVLDQWALSDKTIIMLNGGSSANLDSWYDEIAGWQSCEPTEISHGLHCGVVPYACFHEDAESLNNAITCVGVVLPEAIWGASIEDAGVVTTCNGEVKQKRVKFPDGWSLVVREDEEPVFAMRPNLSTIEARAWFCIKLRRFQFAV